MTQKILFYVHSPPPGSLKPCSQFSSHDLMALYFL